MRKTNEHKNGRAEKTAADIREHLVSSFDLYLPGISVDTVIFSFHQEQLKVLLLRFGNTAYYALPGGFIKKQENLDDAVRRVLAERTGLGNIYLEQFYTSGNNDRSNIAVLHETLKQLLGDLPPNNWMEQRFISVCYYALADETKLNPQIAAYTDEVEWFAVSELPHLLFDHHFIIQKALERLQADLDKKLVGFNLMNETFTMNELQKLYEAVYQKKLVRTNFQRKMLGLGVLERLEKQYNGKAHKAPFLYRFAEAK